MKAIISIEGMTCGHCVSHITSALNGVDGVSQVAVDLANNSATVEMGEQVVDQVLIAAIDEAGYKVTSVDRS